MALFDSIIGYASDKFGLSKEKAGGLLAALLGLIADPQSGGFMGFIDRFRNAGLGDTVNSWITTDANTPISNEQVESALGEDTIGTVGQQSGVDRSTATAAIAGMLPQVVDTLTPDGEVPDENGLLGRIGGFLSDRGGAAAGVVAGGAATAGSAYGKGKDAVKGGLKSVRSEADQATDGGSGSMINWLLPLILLGLLVILGLWFCGRSPAPTAPVNVNANVASSNANIAATRELRASNTNASH